jgi:hypothetical protein
MAKTDPERSSGHKDKRKFQLKEGGSMDTPRTVLKKPGGTDLTFCLLNK